MRWTAGATTITDEMEIAAVHAIAELAQAEQSDVVAAAYVGQTLAFGPEYLIPKPFDPRLMMKIAPAVAQAAADCGVALRPIADMDAYRDKLQSFVLCLRHHDEARSTRSPSGRCTSASPTPRARKSACCAPARWWSTRAWRVPSLIGRPAIIEQRVEKFGLRLEGRPGLRRRQRRARSIATATSGRPTTS